MNNTYGYYEIEFDEWVNSKVYYDWNEPSYLSNIDNPYGYYEMDYEEWFETTEAYWWQQHQLYFYCLDNHDEEDGDEDWLKNIYNKIYLKWNLDKLEKEYEHNKNWTQNFWVKESKIQMDILKTFIREEKINKILQK